jgi:membrane peptidoglycan carboxypeptidase
MRQSVTSGVARNAGLSGVTVAGKTGTAEFGSIRDDGTYETHGWFAGYAPAEDPEIAVVVFVQRGSGGSDASPAAGRILDYYFSGGGPIYGPGEAIPVQDPDPVDVLDATATPGATEAPATDIPEPTATPAEEPTTSTEPEPTALPTETPVSSPTDAPTEPPQETAPPTAALSDERRPNRGVP